jgi:hypothetical protein
VTEVGDGLYVTPIVEPTEKELKEVIAKAGSLSRAQTREEEDAVQEAVKKFRAE